MAQFDEYIGVIARTHGINGAVVLIDTPGVRVNLTPGSVVGVGYSREFARTMTVTTYEASVKSARIAFVEIVTPDDALPLVDQAVYARTTDVVVSDERYSIGDIEGCEVYDDAGHCLGRISDVWLLPANDVWIVDCADGSSIPIPVIDSVIKHVDVPNKRVKVQLLDGLDKLHTSSDEADDADPTDVHDAGADEHDIDVSDADDDHVH